jgi:hypothetical protein
MDLVVILCVKATYKNCRKDFTAPCYFIRELLRLVLLCTVYTYKHRMYHREIHVRGVAHKGLKRNIFQWPYAGLGYRRMH